MNTHINALAFSFSLFSNMPLQKDARSQDRLEQLLASVKALETQQTKAAAENRKLAEQLKGRVSEVSDLKLELARARERLRGAEEDVECQRARFEGKEGEWEGVIRQADERLNEVRGQIDCCCGGKKKKEKKRKMVDVRDKRM
jgi:septal ring factor EnvC (AmiA/AmiB activator)